MKEDDYSELIRNLNEEQKKFLLHILSCFKTNYNIPLYELILGSAGVGKSVLIKAIYQSLLRFYNCLKNANPNTCKVLLCAPTGKAAFNINGNTLHQAFKLPIDQNTAPLTPLSSNIKNTLYSTYRELKLIIIDEISMISSLNFDRLNERLKQIFDSKELFGGISIIAFGDFNQLHPVRGTPIYKNSINNPLHILIDNILWNIFSYYELTEIMRQKEDKEFAVLLSNFLKGELSEKEKTDLQYRCEVSLPNHRIIHLCKSNREVNEHNVSIINTYKYELHNSKDKVLDDTLSKSEKEYLLSIIQDATKYPITKTQGLPLILYLAEGVNYMITNNIDTNDGLVNGAIGTLKLIEKTNDQIIRLWLQFTEEHVGKHIRQELQNHIRINKIPVNLVPIGQVTLSIKIGLKSSSIIARKQFPLTIAEAITIHKSQGSTYKEVAIHRPNSLNKRELYVAMSRVTSLSGLYFINGNLNKLETQSAINIPEEIIKTKKEKFIQFNLHYFQDIEEENTFIFANIQSLKKHIDDIVRDKSFIYTKFLFFVETWTLESDDININDYNIIYRKDCNNNNNRHAYGITIYAKHYIQYNDIQIIFESNLYMNKKSHNLVVFTYQEYCICVLYKLPNTLNTYFLQIIKEMFHSIKLKIMIENYKFIIVGDFNVDINEDKSNIIIKYLLEEKRFKFNLNNLYSSTNFGTQIDLCFSNYNACECKYYENYYGYHKPITCIMNKKYEVNNENKLYSNLENKCHTNQLPQSSNYSNIEKSNISNKIKKINSSNLLRSNLMKLKNIDNVSCYSNSILQCLLNLRKILLENPISEDDNLLKILKYYIEIENITNKPLESRKLREYVGGDYLLQNQQDVCEFLGDLLQNSAILLNKFSYEFITLNKCSECNEERKISEFENCINIDLTKYKNEKSNNVHMNDLLNDYLSTERINAYCDKCKKETSTTRISQITNTNNILAIRCNSFIIDLKKQSTKKKLFSLNPNIYEHSITLNNVEYKLNSSILHFGESAYSGHYAALIKNNNTNWLCDDIKIRCIKKIPKGSIFTINKCKGSSYLFFYERINS